MTKEEEYSVLLISKIEELFQRENEDGEEKDPEEFIDLNDFKESGAYEDFLLSLCLIVPGFLTRKILGKEFNALELINLCTSILLKNQMKELFEEEKKSLTK